MKGLAHPSMILGGVSMTLRAGSPPRVERVEWAIGAEVAGNKRPGGTSTGPVEGPGVPR